MSLIAEGPIKNNTDRTSLDLLQSIVDVGLHPENFSDVCKAWAEHSDDANALQNFESLLNTVYLQNSKIFETRTIRASLAENSDIDSLSFVINQNLQISSCGRQASEILNISVGQFAGHLFEGNPQRIFESATEADGKLSFGDIFDLNGSRHLASIIAIGDDQTAPLQYKFTLWRVELTPEAETYIRENLFLTNVEIDILKLCIQRHPVATIAKIRESSLNTIRTHIRNIKNKFHSNSLTDVISSTYEIIAIHHTELSGSTTFKNNYIPQQRNVILARLAGSEYQVEYSRYGDPTKKPLILLHSIEYGILPPKAFTDLANEKGFCLYVPVRPGFGRTSQADSIKDAAFILSRFIDTLDLKDITLISLSTSAPTALELIKLNFQIRTAVFVNYAFDTENKIKHIKPVWLQGLLEFGLGSQESFKFAFRMSKGMLKVIGHQTYYKKMYQSCEEDLLYLALNDTAFEASANLILSAAPEACRNDIAASFIDNPGTGNLGRHNLTVKSIFGEYTHGISLTPIREKAASLNIPFYVIEGTGRNCIYQKPEVFFDKLDS